MDNSTNNAAILKEENKNLRSELESYKNKFKNAETAYNQLLHSLKEFQRNRFGSKSERFIDENNPQADLFAALADDDLMQDKDEAKEEEDNVIDIAAYGKPPLK